MNARILFAIACSPLFAPAALAQDVNLDAVYAVALDRTLTRVVETQPELLAGATSHEEQLELIDSLAMEQAAQSLIPGSSAAPPTFEMEAIDLNGFLFQELNAIIDVGSYLDQGYIPVRSQGGLRAQFIFDDEHLGLALEQHMDSAMVMAIDLASFFPVSTELEPGQVTMVAVWDDVYEFVPVWESVLNYAELTDIIVDDEQPQEVTIECEVEDGVLVCDELTDELDGAWGEDPEASGNDEGGDTDNSDCGEGSSSSSGESGTSSDSSSSSTSYGTSTSTSTSTSSSTSSGDSSSSSSSSSYYGDSRREAQESARSRR